MSISIQTNFNVYTNYPIDSRLVATDSNARDAIAYKYVGLKVYDKTDQKSYIWTKDNIWKDESINNKKGGIYDGDGVIPSDTGIFLGTVSNIKDNKSFELYDWTSSPMFDKNYIYDYLYRTKDSSDFESISFRKEQKFLPEGGGFIQGPYIEFNGKEPIYDVITNSLILGVISNDPNNARLGPKLVLTNKNYFAFYGDLSSQDQPLTISKFNNQTYLGFNFNPYSSATNYNFSNSQNSYRIKFGDVSNNEMSFETNLRAKSNWTEVLKFQNIDITSLSAPISPIKMLVENSGFYWDALSTKTFNFLSLPELVRDYDHRFSRLQMWNQGTVDFYHVVDNILYLKPDGNSFHVKIPSNQWIEDIKMYKSSTIKPDFPDGTILTIKFQNTPYFTNTYIKLMDAEGTNTSKIYSDVNDAIFSGTFSSRLSLSYNNISDKYGSKSDIGDTMIFRKVSGFWEVVTLNQFRKQVTKFGGLGNSTTWSFRPLSYLNELNSNGIFNDITDTSVAHLVVNSNGNPPNKFNLTTTTVGNSREVSNRDGFKLRFEVRNKKVYVQGNFRIVINRPFSRPDNDGVSTGFLQNFFWKHQRENIFRIGEIFDPNLMPEFESTWFYVSGYVIEGTNQINLVDAKITISRTGIIYLNFKAESTKTIIKVDDYQISNILYMDIWVPASKYDAAKDFSV